MRAALGGSLWGAARTRRSGCGSFWKPRHCPVAGSVRRPCLHPNSAVSLSPVAPKARRPPSLPTRSAGLVPRWARPEDLALPGSSPPVSSLGRVGPKTSLSRVKSCRPRPQAPSVRRPRTLAGWVDSLGRSEKWPRRSVSHEAVPKVRSSQPRPRLWHKVEHVHPGALRGRAVGSAPSIARTLENGPSLALQSRLQRLGDAPCSPRPAPPKWFRGRLAASLELLELPSASSTSGPRPAPLRSHPVQPKPSRRSLGVTDSARGSSPALLSASHPSPALRPEGQGVELERPGFLTRSAPFLPRRVEVLFQTGNTLGVAPPSPACHLPPGARPGKPRCETGRAPIEIGTWMSRVRSEDLLRAVARWRLPTRLAPKGLPGLPAGRVGVATTFLIQFSMSTG
jgi:hypothetical protein